LIPVFLSLWFHGPDYYKELSVCAAPWMHGFRRSTWKNVNSTDTEQLLTATSAFVLVIHIFGQFSCFFHRLDSKQSLCFQEGIILPVFLYPATYWARFEEPALYGWCSESLSILTGTAPYISNYGLCSKLLEGVLPVYCILSLQKLRAIGGSPDKGEKHSFFWHCWHKVPPIRGSHRAGRLESSPGNLNTTTNVVFSQLTLSAFDVCTLKPLMIYMFCEWVHISKIEIILRRE
jgi:hypothetical protein